MCENPIVDRIEQAVTNGMGMGLIPHVSHNHEIPGYDNEIDPQIHLGQMEFRRTRMARDRQSAYYIEVEVRRLWNLRTKLQKEVLAKYVRFTDRGEVISLVNEYLQGREY